VIEHNLDVIKAADWIIDLGPEGGERGGEVVAVGTPETLILEPRSYTGKFLSRVLQANGKVVGENLSCSPLATQHPPQTGAERVLEPMESL
jgi:excinuclease ABC subunit A